MPVAPGRTAAGRWTWGSLTPILFLACLQLGCESADHAVVPRSGEMEVLQGPDGSERSLQPSAEARPNVVLIVVDTLRSDRLGVYGHARDTSPAIDALAGQAVRFTRAYASSSWTKPSVASMLTGLLPASHRVDEMYRKLPEQIETLAERLSGEGYATAAIVSHVLVGSGWGLDRGFAKFDQAEARGPRHVSTPGVTQRAIWSVERLAADAAPFFLFVHYFDPHDSYLDHAEFDFAGKSEGRLKPGQMAFVMRSLDPPPNRDEIGYLLDLYDEEIRLTDKGIGSLIAALERTDAYRDSAIIVTSDHGEEFFESGWLGHGNALSETLLRVPLIIKPPARSEASVVERPVSLVGLAPTILDLTSVEYERDDFEAPSLLPFLEGAAESPAPAIYAELTYAPPESGIETLSGDRPWTEAVIEGRYKLVRNNVDGSLRLYDVISDPEELTDESGDRRELLRRLQGVMDSAGPRAATAKANVAPAVQLEPDESVRETLRQLGYLPDGSSATR